MGRLSALRFSFLPRGVEKNQSQRGRKVALPEQKQPAGPAATSGTGRGAGLSHGEESHLGHIVGGPFVVREL